tara:strand:- start:256 stop:528 length:273 start_codon:yes stop_codon:yes gene_type:complete
MKAIIYKNFKITIEKVLRNKSTNGRGLVSYKSRGNLTETKQYTIEYLGKVSDDVKEMKDHIRIEEFKSLKECKRFIDKGGLNRWIKLLLF